MSGTVTRTLKDRIFEKVVIDLTSGCWLWTGSKTHDGYPQTFKDRHSTYAHRATYELCEGPIPDGLQLDHLCRVRHCVNPAHLEPVTCRENLIRGEGVVAKALAATHCPKGHPYDEVNTIYNRKGHRGCRECGRVNRRAWYRKNYL